MKKLIEIDEEILDSMERFNIKPMTDQMLEEKIEYQQMLNQAIEELTSNGMSQDEAEQYVEWKYQH